MALSAATLRKMEGTCEDSRLAAAGYLVCGSGGDTRWHWQEPNGVWHDGYSSEYKAVKDALKHLQYKS